MGLDRRIQGTKVDPRLILSSDKNPASQQAMRVTAGIGVALCSQRE